MHPFLDYIQHKLMRNLEELTSSDKYLKQLNKIVLYFLQYIQVMIKLYEVFRQSQVSFFQDHKWTKYQKSKSYLTPYCQLLHSKNHLQPLHYLLFLLLFLEGYLILYKGIALKYIMTQMVFLLFLIP